MPRESPQRVTGPLGAFIGYIHGSVRSQPIVAMAVFIITLVIGFGAFVLATPMWSIRTQVVVQAPLDGGGAAFTPQQSLMRISAVDVAQLLRAEAFRGQLSESKPEEAQLAVGRGAQLRRTARDAWAEVCTMPRRLASRLGLADPPTRQMDRAPVLEVLVAEPRDRIVQVTVRAETPGLAESAADKLIPVLRRQLTQSAHNSALERLQELAEPLNEALDRVNAAELVLKEFRLRVGKQDPAGYADHIQRQLAEVRSEISQVDSDIKEFNARREQIVRTLEGLEREHTGQVITGVNSRIAELQREISDLEARYAAMTTMTDRHPVKRAVLEELSIKRAHHKEELKHQTIVEKTITESSPEYLTIRSQQLDVEQYLSRLTGRREGLVEKEQWELSQLAQATRDAAAMLTLEREQGFAETEWLQLSAEAQRLEDVLSSRTIFAHVALVENRPTVSDPTRPDAPSAARYLGVTGLCAFCLALVIPAVRAAGRGRIVTDWQIARISTRLPLQVIGELPAHSPRRLLGPQRSGGG